LDPTNITDARAKCHFLALIAPPWSRKKRTEIVDTAAHLLSIKGFAATRLTDVVEHTQMQPAVIYYHFSSFADVVEEVLYRGILEMRIDLEATLQALPPNTSPVDRLMAAVETHLRRELELSDYCTAWIRNSGQIPGELNRRLKKAQATYGRIWADVFEAAVGRGDAPPGFDLRMGRMLMLGSLNWATSWWDPSRGSVDTLVATAQHLIRSGLGASA
jgi:TetR/AcrR family transcriptional regulator, cholesterol catabolism regulator